VEVAKAVLLWLNREENWLLVFDNLDDITFADGFLPENGPRKHTLINTRNPNTFGIPAEPLEVPLFGKTYCRLYPMFPFSRKHSKPRKSSKNSVFSL
jgi:hypothetical protein